jgi:hypothetical protein
MSVSLSLCVSLLLGASELTLARTGLQLGVHLLLCDYGLFIVAVLLE